MEIRVSLWPGLGLVFPKLPLLAENQVRVGMETEGLVRTAIIGGPHLDFGVRRGFQEEVMPKGGRKSGPGSGAEPPQQRGQRERRPGPGVEQTGSRGWGTLGFR